MSCECTPPCPCTPAVDGVTQDHLEGFSLNLGAIVTQVLLGILTGGGNVNLKNALNGTIRTIVIEILKEQGLIVTDPSNPTSA